VPNVCFAGTPATLDYHQRRDFWKQSMPNTLCFESGLITMLRASLCYSHPFVMKYFLNLLGLNNAGCICNSSTSSTGQSKVVIMPIFTISLYLRPVAPCNHYQVNITIHHLHLSFATNIIHTCVGSSIATSPLIICDGLETPTAPLRRNCLPFATSTSPLSNGTRLDPPLHCDGTRLDPHLHCVGFDFSLRRRRDEHYPHLRRLLHCDEPFDNLRRPRDSNSSIATKLFTIRDANISPFQRHETRSPSPLRQIPFLFATASILCHLHCDEVDSPFRRHETRSPSPLRRHETRSASPLRRLRFLFATASRLRHLLCDQVVTPSGRHEN
jgi:hypothetical protein